MPQINATPTPNKPANTKAERQPQCWAIQAITSGVIAPPAPTPTVVKLIPNPLCAELIHEATARAELGGVKASPAPIRNRTMAKDATRPTNCDKGNSGTIAMAARQSEYAKIAR